MSINLAVPETPITHLKPRISVIGVGGGGGNAVNNMIAKNLEGVDFIVANTDSQALAHSTASRKIQLGLKITQGLGAGARPEIGKLAAEEAQEQIEKELEGSNMVFITAGMGGGTGSGAAPVVAKIAKEKGILTVGVVTKPFDFEGKKRMETAEDAVSKFTKEVDSIIIIPNQNLFRIADKNTTLADAFILADNVLYSGVRSITDLMMMPGLINLDFADIKNIMEDKGKAIMGTGEAEGEDRARIAAEQALSNPLLDDCSMKGAKGVLINITGGNDITLLEIDEAANIIKEQVDEDANIIFGSSFDSSLEGKIRVSIVVTGIENKPGSRFKEKALDTTAYIDESFSPATKAEKNFAIDSQDIDDNLERFSAVKTSEENAQEESVMENTDEQNISDVENKTEDEEKSENQETLVAETENSAVEPDFSRFEDFENIEHSGAISEAPQASALFSAIINKSQSNESSSSRETSIADFIPEEKDIFSSTTQINNFENEPVLFPDPEEPSFLSHQEDLKEEEPIVETPSKTKFIDKILGISRARKNRKDTPVIDDRFAEPTAPSFSNTSEALDYSNDIPDNLDIPSFLRRK
ncbi:MAG: cell division protein FtsZ [Alphaproteobacteria bacterium]|nr:cell division protein FtsZ [Alphaproteobacteria bacterium]